MRARIAAALLGLTLASLATVGAASRPIVLGGVEVGTSILEVVRRLGFPTVVQTTAEGHLWQWSSTGGLDREILTDDDMDVVRVLVARALPTAPSASASLPAELPVLGLPSSASADVVDSAGGVPLAQTSSSERAWLFEGGILVERYVNSITISVTAMDRRTGRTLGYLWPSLAALPYVPPTLVKEAESAAMPSGVGMTVIRALISASGQVADARVVVPSGDSEIDRWALDEIRRSTFAPATRGGVPCAGVYLDVDGVLR